MSDICDLCDRVVAISQWLYDALLLNGFPKHKLALCLSGGPNSLEDPDVLPRTNMNTLRVGYFGRWDKLKGIDFLVRAIKAIPENVSIELTIHGLPGSQVQIDYRALVEREAEGSSRVKIAEGVRKEDVQREMARFDVIAIPSQLLETGPLVALEAHAAKVPIVASNLGGLAERIRHGVDGLLVPATDERAWTDALMRLASDRQLLMALRNGIRSVRIMKDVAREMAEVYRGLTCAETIQSNAIRTLSGS